MKIAFKQSYLTRVVLLAALVVSGGAALADCGVKGTPCAKLFYVTNGSCKQLAMDNNFSCWPDSIHDAANGRVDVAGSGEGYTKCSVNVKSDDNAKLEVVCVTSNDETQSFYFLCRSGDGNQTGHWKPKALAGYADCVKGASVAKHAALQH